MPSAVTAIFGADSTPLQAELRRVESMAAASGRRVTSQMAGEARSGFAGIVREMTVIGREIAMGKGSGRIAASFTLLFQYLRTLASNARDAAAPARLVAEAYEQAALKASIAATANMRKAQASEMAFMADAQETEATLDAAIADRAKAQASEQVAIATQAKAVAAREAAAAEEAEAAASAGAGSATTLLTTGIAALALVAAVVYEYFWGYSKALKEAGMAIPELKDNDYIPLLKRHMSDARNAQKEITDEVNRTRDAYQSASEVAKRVADATREHYDTQRKLLDIHKQTELARTHSPAQRLAIEKKYSDQQLKLQQDEHKEQLSQMAVEKSNLEKESGTKFDAASKIKVASKEEDEQTLRQLNTNAEAAEAYLKGGGVWKEFKKQAAAQLGGSPLDLAARDRAIADAESGGMDAANARIAERNKFADKVAQNDEDRKRKAQLESDAAKSAAAAALIGLQTPDVQNKLKNQEMDAAAEAKATLELERAQMSKSGNSGSSLNEQQRVGAYATTPPDFNQLVGAAKKTAANTEYLKPSGHSTAGPKRAHFGGVSNK